MPGNGRLRRDEAGLPRASVVNVSPIRTIERTRLVERVGVLGGVKMRDVLNGTASRARPMPTDAWSADAIDMTALAAIMVTTGKPSSSTVTSEVWQRAGSAAARAAGAQSAG
jgi:hypothetical protein